MSIIELNESLKNIANSTYYSQIEGCLLLLLFILFILYLILDKDKLINFLIKLSVNLFTIMIIISSYVNSGIIIFIFFLIVYILIIYTIKKKKKENKNKNAYS